MDTETRLSALEDKTKHIPTLEHIIGELRKDTDKNTEAIQGVQQEVRGLASTINRAAWTISGGVSVTTFFFFVLNLYLQFKG